MENVTLYPTTLISSLRPKLENPSIKENINPVSEDRPNKPELTAKVLNKRSKYTDLENTPVEGNPLDKPDPWLPNTVSCHYSYMGSHEHSELQKERERLLVIYLDNSEAINRNEEEDRINGNDKVDEFVKKSIRAELKILLIDDTMSEACKNEREKEAEQVDRGDIDTIKRYISTVQMFVAFQTGNAIAGRPGVINNDQATIDKLQHLSDQIHRRYPSLSPDYLKRISGQ